MMLRRLDSYATDGLQFHKPRHGACPLCERPVVDHPCCVHRRAALRELLIRKIDRALLILAWH